MRGLADKKQVVRFLRRTGLESLIRRVLRVVCNPRLLILDRVVEADYRAFKKQYGAILSPGRELADPDRRVLFLSFASYTAQLKAESFLAKVLQLYGVTPVMVTASWLKRALKYYRAFGIGDFAFFDRVQRQVPPEALDIIEEFFSQPFSVQDVRNFHYKGTRLGAHMLRTLTRTTHKGFIDLSDPRVTNTLKAMMRQGMENVERAEALLDEYRPEIVFTHHPLNMEEGDIFEVALVRGLNAIYWNDAQKTDYWIFKRYSQKNKGLQYFSVDDETWEIARQMEWTPEHEAILMEEIRRRYDPASRADSRLLQQGKQMKDRETIRQQLELDPGKKTAVVFSHITWDTSFLYGQDLFNDYEDWLVQTTRAACDNPRLNWIIKLHPANLTKFKAWGMTGEYSEVTAIRNAIGELPEHVKLLYPETDINTFSLFALTDYCLTVRGTIGIEMTLFGIPVFTAGTGRYSGRGFTIDSTTRGEYLDRLAHLHEYGPLSPEQVELAKKHAYWLFMKRPVRFELASKVLPLNRLQRAGHPLETNYVFHFRSLDDLAHDPGLKRFAEWVLEEQSPDFYF